MSNWTRWWRSLPPSNRVADGSRSAGSELSGIKPDSQAGYMDLTWVGLYARHFCAPGRNYLSQLAGGAISPLTKFISRAMAMSWVQRLEAITGKASSVSPMT